MADLPDPRADHRLAAPRRVSPDSLDAAPSRSRRQRLLQRARPAADWKGWEYRLLQLAMILSGGLLLVTVISVPLELWEQVVFAVLCAVIALLVNHFPGRFTTLVLTFISLAVSSRYVYWRLTETLPSDNWLDVAFGSGLIAAEVYAWVVLLLGFFQTIWPLERKPVAMSLPIDEWPTVDVFIPTYNEPLKVVKPTVFAAMALDWPADKLRIHILDDGQRPEFQAFAEEIGVQWVIRSDNRHAKAGNINAALAHTDGQFVAIFDSDHIPTRSFLQMSVGWFLKDPDLAMLQTPHHFFSPDPFERNLGTFGEVPNENELFYGLVQDGNDLWNATFFCGSCAVLRREALDEVGGLATETVTEDAHTALRLHRHGWNTAYIAIPQAAGLATESLAAHVGQRVRWARGMAQIFRIDCPLLGKGLSLAQRLCYSNAMLHFFYGLPRIVFLTAPLAYLFFEAHVIHASALMIAAMALPHLFHASLVNSRTQGRFRHSFWAEVYESVLAWYILRPTLVALVNPRAGAFNVTAKGGYVERDYVDWGIARPYLLIFILNVIGLCLGMARLFWLNPDEPDTVVMNLVWTVYNLIILGAAVAASAEARQVRHSHRVQLGIPAQLRTDDGQSWQVSTDNFSEGGLSVRLPPGVMLPEHTRVALSLYRGDLQAEFSGEVVFRRGERHGLKFDPLTLAQQKELVETTFSRADAWLHYSEGRQPDHPGTALVDVLRHGLRGCASVFGLRRQRPVETPAVTTSKSA